MVLGGFIMAAILEGLWVVQYTGVQGFDNGVVVLIDGKVLGGDNGFTYIGTYQQTEAGLNAKVTVHNFDPRVASVVPIPGDHTLNLEVRWQGEGVLQGTGGLSDQSAIGIAVKLTKHASLR
jgi:hypothetical protein